MCRMGNTGPEFRVVVLRTNQLMQKAKSRWGHLKRCDGSFLGPGAMKLHLVARVISGWGRKRHPLHQRQITGTKRVAGGMFSENTPRGVILEHITVRGLTNIRIISASSR